MDKKEVVHKIKNPLKRDIWRHRSIDSASEIQFNAYRHPNIKFMKDYKN